MKPVKGEFYEFHSTRIASRPGDLIYPNKTDKTSITSHEIGPFLERKEAIRKSKLGLDVYTLRRRYALELSNEIYMKDSKFHPPHGPAYFPHFHPGSEDHFYKKNREGRMRAYEGPGHVLFGERGEGFDANRATERKLADIQRDEDRLKKALAEKWGNRHDKSDSKPT